MIAVVMDVFTDVDIFKDLIETGFKKKVAIYIIIDFCIYTALPTYVWESQYAQRTPQCE